jgi:hypothetical protein
MSGIMSQGRHEALSAEDGRRAVELARESVQSFVEHGRRQDPGSMRDAFYMRAGAVVRLETADRGGRLRGCASAPERPTTLAADSVQLGHAIVDAAVRAASDESRGEVRPAELSNLAVSVFTVQGIEECEDPESELRVGKDGVAMEGRESMAWLYPTVPDTQGWSAVECLDRTARKAGLPGDAWESPDVTVLRLAGQVFEQEAPGGHVREFLE